MFSTQIQRSLIDANTAPVFSIEDLAFHARQSKSTIRRRIDDGTLQVVHLGRSVRIVGQSARNYLAGAKQ